MSKKYRLGQMILAAVNSVAIIGAVVLTAAGGHAADSQRSNHTAENFSRGSEYDYGQVSCYFSKDAKFDKNEVYNLKGRLYNDLKSVSIVPEDGADIVRNAYSTEVGGAFITCDMDGTAEAEVTVVGGDFFLFRDFELLSGSFFSDRDSLRDGAVIDKELAWQLYGSLDIAGKAIYINDRELYISGVIETPSTEPEQKCIGAVPMAYISYEAAGDVFPYEIEDQFVSDDGGAAQFTRVTCYECIIPEPVEHFAYNSVKTHIAEAFRGNVDIVNNSERFLPGKRAKALKKLDSYIIRNDSIVYPFWENASRIVEFKLSFIYGGRRLLLAIPLITFICLLALAYRNYKRKKEDLKKAVERFFSGKMKKIREKKQKAAEIKEKSSEKESEQTKES